MSEPQTTSPDAGADTAPAQQETRDRILDAAERLFSEHGFQAVSLRQITSTAGVNVASVNYHFGSREALVSEVLARVLDPINRERLRLLGEFEAEAGGEPVPIERIVEAAYRPIVIDMPKSHEATRRFLRLAGQCLGGQTDEYPETIKRVFSEIVDRFLAAFTRTLPHLEPADILWRMHFAAGTLLYALTKDEQLVVMSNGEIPRIDPEETMAQLMAWAVAGMTAPAPARRAEATKPGSKEGMVGVVTLLSAGLLGLLGVGCAATSPPNADALADVGAVPEDWQADSESPSRDDKNPGVLIADSDWVASFGDEKLESLVDQALVNNRDLKAAAARIEIAQANARIAGADLYPQAQGLFRGSRKKQNFIGFPFGDFGGGDSSGGGESAVFSNLNNEFGLALDLSWEIDLWGRIRAGQSAMISEAEAVEADRAAAELSIAGQVAKSWFALQEAQEQVNLAEAAVEVFQDTERAIRDRFEAGIANEGQNLASQLRLAMVDVETAREKREQRKEEVERLARRIELLLGKYPGAKLKSGRDLPAVPSAPPAGMPAVLLDRRPDLLASERRLASADRRLVEAKRALFPSISLTGSTGTSSEQIDDLLNSDFSIWSIAGSAAQPLLVGGRLRQGIKLKRAEVEKAAAEFEQTALTAFGEVENALAAEQYLAKRQQALDSAVDLAKEAFERSSEEFTDGTGDILTMLTAQQRYFQQRVQFIAIKRMRLENRVDLHLALGGGFVAPPRKIAEPPPDEA
ncbi:MAG: efflux transporter outer membrane subunit [Verrucomicrobiae bacterium]|nr:efflux transporter outer membrane subunit [Verrucomicrobiae bacterium]